MTALIVVGLFGAVQNARAQETATSSVADDEWGEESWEEDDGVGFEDVTIEGEPEKITEPSNLRISGFFRTDNALWVERFNDNPMAKARQNLDLNLRYAFKGVRLKASLHLEYDLAYLVQRDDYDDATLDAYEWLIQPRELMLAVALGPFDLTIGRQIVAWGEGEVISPLDVVNPRDDREPGLTDLEDARLPVLATRLAYSVAAHTFELMVVHESFFGLRSSPLGPFSPLSALLAADGAEAAGLRALLAERSIRFVNSPGRFVTNAQQAFFRWRYRGEGGDLALYAASVLFREGVLRLPAVEQLLAMEQIELLLEHPRYAVFGQSGALPLPAALLLRWEVSVDVQRPINGGDPAAFPPEYTIVRHTFLNLMAGLSYTGLENLNATFEFGQSLILDGAPSADGGPLSVDTGATVVVGRSPQLIAAVDAPVLALRVSYSLFRQRLELSAVGTVLGWTAQFGWLARAEVSYQLLDGLKLGLGYITYQPGRETGPFSGLDRHDRLFAKLRWDFLIW